MGDWLYLFCGVWALAMLVIFIQAIRLSYRIEARSPELADRYSFPVNAQIFHTVTNYKVARDPETQAMRRRMNWLLLVSVAGMALMGIVVSNLQQH